MAKQMLKGLTMLMLVAVLSLAAAVVSAQGQSSRRVAATIPFEFTVGSKELPAGNYSVAPSTTGSDAMQITGDKDSAIRLSSTLIRHDTGKGKLVFHRYGNQYFLAEIWVNGESRGHRLMKSAAERAMEREQVISSNRRAQSYDRVEIALAR